MFFPNEVLPYPFILKLFYSQAVDGNTVNDITQCAILDSFYDSEPQLTIDLGHRKDVSGVVIYMWEGIKDSKS